MQRSFVADGGGLTVLALSDDANIPLARTQRNLTPLQRMVLTLALETKQEKIEEEMPNNQGSGRIKNSLAGGDSNKRTETIIYTNDGDE